LGNHLLLCGTKTDQCPKCRQFIQRAVYIYHIENDCAVVDEIETRSTKPKNHLTHRPLVISSRIISKNDFLNDDYQHNYPGQDTLMYPFRITDRIPSSVSNASQFFVLF
jgi:hypothetical protein